MTPDAPLMPTQQEYGFRVVAGGGHWKAAKVIQKLELRCLQLQSKMLLFSQKAHYEIRTTTSPRTGRSGRIWPYA